MLGSEMVACPPAERWVVPVAPSIPCVSCSGLLSRPLCSSAGRGAGVPFLFLSAEHQQVFLHSFFFFFFHNGFKRKHQSCHVYLSVLVSVAQRFLGFT